MPGQAAAQLPCHPVHPRVPTPTSSRSVLQLLLPLFCCSVSSFAALIQPAKKHQGFSKKQQNKDLFCCKTMLLHPPAPTHHPRTLLPSWGFPGVCPEHRAGPLPVGHPPTRCTSHPCPLFTASPWSKQELVMSPLCPLKVVANLCSSRAFRTVLPGNGKTWYHHPQSTEVRGHISHHMVWEAPAAHRRDTNPNAAGEGEE